MNTASTQNVARERSTSRATLVRLLWSSWAASVPIVALVTIAVEAVPHARGIAFFPALRYAIIMPLCSLLALAATFLYGTLRARVSRPRLMLTVFLLGLSFGVLLGIAFRGPRGFTAAAVPAVLTMLTATGFLVPYFVDQERRSFFGTITIVFGGLLQFVALLGALSTERLTQPSLQELASGIPRTMFDADQKFIDLPSGARIHYVDEGQGETLLFLHGNPSWSFQWRDLIGGLRGSYRCVALDYPGFGMSSAPLGFGFTPLEESRVLEEFVDRLGLDDLTLVMQDWGGPIGLGLAERRPELVRRVILGSTWAWRTSKSEPRGKFSVIFGGPIGEFIQVNFPGIISLGLKQNVVRKLPSEVIEIYTRPFLAPDRRGITAFYPGQITAADDYFMQLEAGLPHLADKKALIFWGLKDPGFSRTDLARWKQTFPNQETIEFPNASHFFFEDEADQMIPAIRAFMSLHR